jgi:hypothetical protein
VLALLALAAVIATTLVFAQSPFAPSRFEYGVYRDYQGTLETWPNPMLIANGHTYLLTTPGKRAFNPAATGPLQVRLRGALIENRDRQMLEVEPASLITLGPASPTLQLDLGDIILTGEIVDTKCYLGVMNPGEGRVHRDCAIRCISGGAPPALLARDANGATELVLLTGFDPHSILDRIAQPVTVRGQLLRRGEQLVLSTTAREITPLP